MNIKHDAATKVLQLLRLNALCLAVGQELLMWGCLLYTSDAADE